MPSAFLDPRPVSLPLPHYRYSCVAEMKQELDNPDSVKVTGRAERLQPPVMQQAEGGMNKMMLWMILIPVAIIVLFFVFLRPPAKADSDKDSKTPKAGSEK